MAQRMLLAGVKSYRAARKAAPWAAVIAKVDEGYIVFETVRDYREWRNQK